MRGKKPTNAEMARHHLPGLRAALTRETVFPHERRRGANRPTACRCPANRWRPANSRKRGRKCRAVGQPARPPATPSLDQEQLLLRDAGGHLGAGGVEIDVDLAAHPEAPREIDAGLDREPHARYESARVLGLEIVDVGPRAVQVAIDRVSCSVDKVLSEARL